MASRPVWKGYLKLSLISVPVKAFTAQKSDSGAIQLNQLHNECHSRIKYQKTCPIHGEVTNPEPTDQELRLTAQLMHGMTKKKFNFDEYTDHYRDRLKELIEAKIEGKKLVTTPVDDAPVVINLMDALKASLNQIPATKSVQKAATGKKSFTPPKELPARVEPKGRERKRSPLEAELSTPTKRKGRRKTG